MSVEEGDLEILLGGATQRIYENTAAIGQLKTRTRGRSDRGAERISD